MEKQGTGAITVTSSVAGLGYAGKMHIGYSTTKAAVLNFAKCTAVQYAPKGVRYIFRVSPTEDDSCTLLISARINAVIPGLIFTPLVSRLASEFNNGDFEGLVKKRSEGVPQ